MTRLSAEQVCAPLELVRDVSHHAVGQPAPLDSAMSRAGHKVTQALSLPLSPQRKVLQCLG